MTITLTPVEPDTETMPAERADAPPAEQVKAFAAYWQGMAAQFAIDMTLGESTVPMVPLDQLEAVIAAAVITARVQESFVAEGYARAFGIRAGQRGQHDARDTADAIAVLLDRRRVAMRVPVAGLVR